MKTEFQFLKAKTNYKRIANLNETHIGYTKCTLFPKNKPKRHKKCKKELTIQAHITCEKYMKTNATHLKKNK